MKVKTKDLTGPALDWAVAKCEARPTGRFLDGVVAHPNYNNFHPSTDWSQGGALIEQECIKLAAYEASSEVPKNPAYWEAVICTRWATYRQTGPTPLIAAMRCYVASNLGDVVEVPYELV